MSFVFKTRFHHIDCINPLMLFRRNNGEQVSPSDRFHGGNRARRLHVCWKGERDHVRGCVQKRIYFLIGSRSFPEAVLLLQHGEERQALCRPPVS